MSRDVINWIGKGIVSVVLIYLLYIVVTCPCSEQLFCCHLGHIYIAILIILVVIFAFNGISFSCPV
jgi:hypothetical protein